MYYEQKQEKSSTAVVGVVFRLKHQQRHKKINIMTTKIFSRDSFLTGIIGSIVSTLIVYVLFNTFIFELRYFFSEKEILSYTVIEIINTKGQYHTLKLQYQEDTMSIIIKDRYMKDKIGDKKPIRILRSTGEKSAKSNIMFFLYPIVFVFFLYCIFLLFSQCSIYIKQASR